MLICITAGHLHWQILSHTDKVGVEGTSRINTSGAFRGQSGDEMIALVSVVSGEDNQPPTITLREVNPDRTDKDAEEKSIGQCVPAVCHSPTSANPPQGGDVRTASQSDLYTLSDRASNFFGTYDPNYDPQSAVLGMYMSGHINSMSFLMHVRPEEEDSPYPEVRSAVANFDDPSMPVSTLRAWVLGILWAILIPGMNQFFYFRYPSVAIGSVSGYVYMLHLSLTVAQLVAQLLVFPVGRAWVRVVPTKTICGVELNPGPFTIKEHVRNLVCSSSIGMLTIASGTGARYHYG